MNAIIGAIVTGFVGTLERALIEAGEVEATKAVDWLESELAVVRKRLSLPQSDAQAEMVETLQRQVKRPEK